jgi:hypothetical protein
MRTVIKSLSATAVLLAMAPAVALAKVSAKPDPSGLPGSAQGEQVVNGLFFWALLSTLGGLFASVLLYAAARHFNNHHYAQAGKGGILVMAGLALVTGAGPAIINFFADLGQQVR